MCGWLIIPDCDITTLFVFDANRSCGLGDFWLQSGDQITRVSCSSVAWSKQMTDRAGAGLLRTHLINPKIFTINLSLLRGRVKFKYIVSFFSK